MANPNRPVEPDAPAAPATAPVAVMSATDLKNIIAAAEGRIIDNTPIEPLLVDRDGVVCIPHRMNDPKPVLNRRQGPNDIIIE